MKYLILAFSIFIGSLSQAQVAVQSVKARPLDIPPFMSSIVQETTGVLKTIRPEAGVGTTYFAQEPDGNWYQAPFPFDLDMSSISGSVGFAFKITERDFLRLGFNYLGKVKSKALATASDEDYAECKYETSKCWPLSHWYGKGHTKQIYLTYDRSFRLLGVVVIVEGGAVLNRVDWKVNIPDWIPARDATPRAVLARHHAIWRPSGSLGAGVQLNDRYRVMLTANYAPSKNDGFYSVANGKSLTLTVVRKF